MLFLGCFKHRGLELIKSMMSSKETTKQRIFINLFSSTFTYSNSSTEPDLINLRPHVFSGPDKLKPHHIVLRQRGIKATHFYWNKRRSQAFILDLRDSAATSPFPGFINWNHIPYLMAERHKDHNHFTGTNKPYIGAERCRYYISITGPTKLRPHDSFALILRLRVVEATPLY